MADHADLWLEMGQQLELSEEEIARNATPRMKGAQEFALWMHNPITQAFFAYLGDVEVNLRESLVEFFVRGFIEDGSPRQDKNPQVWRGRVLAVEDLRRIDLSVIADFYRQKRGADPE